MTIDSIAMIPWSGSLPLPDTTGAGNDPQMLADAFDQVFASLLSQSMTSLSDAGETHGLGGGLFGELAGYAMYQALSAEPGLGLGRQWLSSLGYPMEAER